MAIDGKESPTYAEESYIVGSTGLITQTLSLWLRKISDYIIIVGIISVLFTIVKIGISLFIYGVNLSNYMASDPLTFLLNVFYLFISTDAPADPVQVVMTASLFLFVGMIIFAIITGAAMSHALDDYLGNDTDVGRSLSNALSKGMKLIVTQLAIGLVSSIVVAPGIVLMSISTVTQDVNTLTTGFLMFLVGIIIALYAYVRLAPALAVVIAEGLSPSQALTRAFELTRGRFFHVFIAQIFIFLLIFIIQLGVALFLTPVALMNTPISLIIERIIMDLFFTAIPLIFPVVLYKDLKARSLMKMEEYLQ